MAEFFLRIYDFLSRRKPVTALFLLLIVSVLLILALRLGFEEDISKFLPVDPESEKYSDIYAAMGSKDNIVLIFSANGQTAEAASAANGSMATADSGETAQTAVGGFGNETASAASRGKIAAATQTSIDEDSIYAIEDAIDLFESKWTEYDSTGMVGGTRFRVDSGQSEDMMDFIAANYPLFMTEGDYVRIDSIFAKPDFVRAALEADRQMLLFPTGAVVADNLKSDPLHLFLPVLKRLCDNTAQESFNSIDGYLFTADGLHGLAFMTSPYGMSESGRNSAISTLVDKVCKEVDEESDGVTVTAVGAPLIAVTNATQIRKDSLTAMAIALILLALLLSFTFKRLSDIIWIAVPIAFGWLLAVALISLIHSTMSIIVLGLGTVIIGIALNYPLHFIDGLKSGTSVRDNLKEMVSPLLVGNITTVSAFFCLIWLDAVAMRDLGLFASLMLIGTILFVLVFLPVFVRPRKNIGKTLELGRILPDKVPANPWLLIAVGAITVLMVILSRNTGFDDNMQHINYMTAQQRADLRLLEGGLSSSGAHQLYAVAEGEDLDAALSNNNVLRQRMEGLLQEGKIAAVKGPGNFLPSMEEQETAIAIWKAYWGEGKAGQLLAAIAAESGRAGFADDAFESFKDILTKEYTPLHAAEMTALTGVFDGTYILQVNGSSCVLNTISYADYDKLAEIKNRLSGKVAATTTAATGPPASAEAGSGPTTAALSQAVKAEIFGPGDVSNRLATALSDCFNYIGFVCGIVVFIFLCLFFRRLELSLLSFLPLAVSWFWILGTMQIFSMQFNIVNIILATFIFGQGDDYTIFITEGLIYEYAYKKKRMEAYKNSVFNSALIMFIGIGALIVAKHPAMKSLAEVTIIGMFVVVVMAYYLPPVIFRWLTAKKGIPRDVPVTIRRILNSLCLAGLFVGIMFLFVYPYTFIYFLFGDSEYRRLKYHRFLQRMAAFMVRHFPGIKVEIAGKADFDTPSVVICNHQSLLDLLCLMSLSPRFIFFTNDRVWNNPFYCYAIHKAEFHPVSDGLDVNIESIRKLVERGYSPVVFPEGTRSADCSIGRFHRGAFYLASNLGLEITPLLLHGAGYVLSKSELMLKEGSILVEIGERVKATPDYRADTRVWHRRYIEHYREVSHTRETPERLARYISYKYMYKGASVEAACRRTLKNLPAWTDAPVCEPTVRILNCGQGELAWIFALRHKNVDVYAYDDDEDKILIAKGGTNLPANLHFFLTPAEGFADNIMEIDQSMGKRIPLRITRAVAGSKEKRNKVCKGCRLSTGRQNIKRKQQKS